MGIMIMVERVPTWLYQTVCVCDGNGHGYENSLAMVRNLWCVEA